MESKSVGRAYHTGARNWWRRRPLPAPPPTSSAPRGWSSTTAGARTRASKKSESAPHANATTAGAGVLGEPEACANGPTFGPCGERTGTGGRCGAGTGARRDSIAGRGGNARGSMTRNPPRVREYGAFRAIDQSGDTSSCESSANDRLETRNRRFDNTRKPSHELRGLLFPGKDKLTIGYYASRARASRGARGAPFSVRRRAPRSMPRCEREPGRRPGARGRAHGRAPRTRARSGLSQSTSEKQRPRRRARGD